MSNPPTSHTAASGPSPAALPGARHDPIGARSWLPAVIAIGVVGGAYVGCERLFRVLDGIDNSPEMYKEFGGVISWWALAAGALAAALAAGIFFACPPERSPRFRRAAATALIALPLGFVFWWIPAPFAVTRVVTYLVLMFAAARLAIASVVPARSTPSWAPPMAALAAGAIGARVLLLMKLNGLGWAFAID